MKQREEERREEDTERGSERARERERDIRKRGGRKIQSERVRDRDRQRERERDGRKFLQTEEEQCLRYSLHNLPSMTNCVPIHYKQKRYLVKGWTE